MLPNWFIRWCILFLTFFLGEFLLRTPIFKQFSKLWHFGWHPSFYRKCILTQNFAPMKYTQYFCSKNGSYFISIISEIADVKKTRVDYAIEQFLVVSLFRQYMHIHDKKFRVLRVIPIPNVNACDGFFDEPRAKFYLFLKECAVFFAF